MFLQTKSSIRAASYSAEKQAYSAPKQKSNPHFRTLEAYTETFFTKSGQMNDLLGSSGPGTKTNCADSRTSSNRAIMVASFLNCDLARRKRS
jgi:hypothetical protein